MLAFCEEGRRRQTGPGADVPCPREAFRWRCLMHCPVGARWQTGPVRTQKRWL